MRGFDVLEIPLEGDARMSLDRASTRSGNNWLGWFIRKVGTYPGVGQQPDLETVIGYLETAAERSRRLLQRAPWPVRFVNAEAGPDEALAEAMRSLIVVPRQNSSEGN
jgi:hypothetical protein